MSKDWLRGRRRPGRAQRKREKIRGREVEEGSSLTDGCQELILYRRFAALISSLLQRDLPLIRGQCSGFLWQERMCDQFCHRGGNSNRILGGSWERRRNRTIAEFRLRGAVENLFRGFLG